MYNIYACTRMCAQCTICCSRVTCYIHIFILFQLLLTTKSQRNGKTLFCLLFILFGAMGKGYVTKGGKHCCITVRRVGDSEEVKSKAHVVFSFAHFYLGFYSIFI